MTVIGAIVRSHIVDTLIVLDEAQIGELETALDCEIVDARPYGLAPGDLRTEAGWTRNAGGEQMLLPLLEQAQYDSYSVAVQRAVDAEERLAFAEEATAYEALAILSGEVEE